MIPKLGTNENEGYLEEGAEMRNDLAKKEATSL